MHSPFGFRTLGAAAGLASLAYMMAAGGQSPKALGVGLAGLLVCLLSRLAPKPKTKPAEKRVAVPQAPEAAPNPEGLGEMIAAYRAGGVHPMLATDIRKAG